MVLFPADAAQNRQRKTTQSTPLHPAPRQGTMQTRTIDHAIDLLAGHCLGADEVAIAQQGDQIPFDAQNAVYDETPAGICHDDRKWAEVLLPNRAQQNRRATTEEGEHALSLYGHADRLAFEEQVAHGAE